MKKQIVLLGLVLLGATAMAQTISLDYVDGSVEVRTGANSWKPAVEGTKFGPDAVLRVTSGGAAELTAPTSKIHLAKDGIYQLKDLLASPKAPDTNVASLASKALDRMVTGKRAGKTDVANMGVRAADANAGQVAWAGDDDAAPEPVSVLAKARTLASQGRPAAALKTLRDGKLGSSDPDYWASLVLTSTQALEVQDAELAYSSADQALKGPLDLETRQTLLVTQGLALSLSGDFARAKDLFVQASGLGPKTVAGAEAGRLGSVK